MRIINRIPNKRESHDRPDVNSSKFRDVTRADTIPFATTQHTTNYETHEIVNFVQLSERNHMESCSKMTRWIKYCFPGCKCRISVSLSLSKTHTHTHTYVNIWLLRCNKCIIKYKRKFLKYLQKFCNRHSVEC